LFVSVGVPAFGLEVLGVLLSAGLTGAGGVEGGFSTGGVTLGGVPGAGRGAGGISGGAGVLGGIPGVGVWARSKEAASDKAESNMEPSGEVSQGYVPSPGPHRSASLRAGGVPE
jgi:hypothetical protein